MSSKRRNSFGAALASATARANTAKMELREPTPATSLDVRSVSLTAADVDFVERLAKAASKEIGRKISFSAAVRAIIRSAADRDPATGPAQLIASMFAEIDAGSVVWGERFKRQPTSRVAPGQLTNS